MPNYAKMYAIVCAAADAAITELEKGRDEKAVCAILQNALWQAEELFLSDMDSES